VHSGKGKLGAHENGIADLSSRDPLAQTVDAGIEAEDLRHAQQQVRLARRFNHLTAFVGAVAHRFSTSTGLPHFTASRTSARWHEFGVVTKTASTSSERHIASAESNASGILNFPADS